MARVKNLNSTSPTSFNMDVSDTTTLLPTFQNEDDINEYLKTAVSIPYLQMIDSTGVFSSSKEIVTTKNIISEMNQNYFSSWYN